jgi:two-component system NtrC family sensor kinase
MVWEWTGPRLTAPESAALIMLAASLLVFRTFRERYLLIWNLGWLVYLVSFWPNSGMLANLSPQLGTAIREAGFVLAVGVFSGAILIYCHARRTLPTLLVVVVLSVSFAITRALFWPNQPILRAALEAMYRCMSFVAAVRLGGFFWRRWRFGPWLLVFSLLLWHLDWGPWAHHPYQAFDMLLELMMGLGMLMLVLDHYRDRTRRLSAVNTITSALTRAQQPVVMLRPALQELMAVTECRAGWFRMLNGQQLILTCQVGISERSESANEALTMDETLEKVLHSGRPAAFRVRGLHSTMREQLEQEKMHHVLIIPVRGKKSVVGMIVLGARRRRGYLPEEVQFMANTANQLGIALENLRLRELILRSQRQWTNTFDSIEDLILVHDSDYTIIKTNRAMMRRLKKRPMEIVTRSCTDALPNSAEWKNCPYCDKGESGLREGPDPAFGGVSLVSTSSYVEHGGKRKGTIHIIHDTTERRAAEEKYRLLFEQAQEGVFVATLQGKLVECNDAFVRMLGYAKREELMAVNFDKEIYAQARQREELGQQLQQHSSVRGFEVSMRRKDGSTLNVLQSSIATHDAKGAIERYQGFVLDMTEKKRADDEIRRRNRELNALNSMATVANQSFDLDEILNLTMRQVVSLFSVETGAIYLGAPDLTQLRRRAGWGHRPETRSRFAEIRLPQKFVDLVRQSHTEVVTPEYLPHLPQTIAEYVKSDGLRSWIWVILWSKDRPFGVVGVGSREAREFSRSEENLLVAISKQLSATIEKVHLYEDSCRAYEDLRQAQEQLLQSEKMSAVGQLISGVAHELNNPLTAILGYAQLLESEGLNERARDFIQKIFKQAQRTHRVVQNLLSFARQRKTQRVEVDIRKVLDETLALRDYDFKVSNIQVQREQSPRPLMVTADPHQLEQVFLNIINNGVDAILEAGTSGSLKVSTTMQDGFVVAEFRDSGPGIREPKRIFDPFYTTKAVGKGTGLGLSICYGIVKEHGGQISASNQPEGGAIITVKLPVATTKATVPEAPAAQPQREVLQGCLLLVEDEDAVLEFARDVLSGAGAEVRPVKSAEEAKTLLKSEKFDAILMNGRLPGAAARPMHEWLLEHVPDMAPKTLFAFSHLPEAETKTYLEEKAVPSLVKPFEINGLISSVRTLMRKAQAAAASAS